MNKPTVRLGSYGPIVRQLQSNLNLGTSILAKLKEDGSFGGKTDARVREFQGQSKLTADGVVGPMTWQAVEEFLLKVTEMAGSIVPPADQEAARQRICDTAMLMYNQFGWNGQVDPKNPRIAGKKCADSFTRARQGGAQIFSIFSVAGAPNPQKCLTLSKQAEQMYGRQYTAQERNSTDIVSWCGIFSNYVYKISGLNISSWPLRYSMFGMSKPSDELKVTMTPRRGDIGVVDPMGGLNHHFIVVEVQGDSLTTIDGNAGWYMEIVKNTYTLPNVKKRQGYFLTPIWEKVLG